jgi:hemoglobin
MDELPEADVVRGMHAPNLQGSESKLFKFLSGWLGGPNLYWEEFGHPRLRMRHLPFSIGVNERDQWLVCMRNALDSQVQDVELREHLYAAFVQTANHMINRAE